MNHLGDRLRALREKAKENQGELGEALSLTVGAISNIERSGKTSTETIEAICSHYKVSREWLVNGEGEAPKGIVIPLKQGQSEAPWKDEAYKALQAENMRLWRLIEKITGAPAGSIANFSNAVGKAGKQISLLPTVKAA